jgi:YYY domain-containing protein
MSDAWLWWLFIQMLGLACLPLTFSIFANLPDRGWALSKALGVLSLCFLVWFPLTLPSILPGPLAGLALPYARGTILAFLLLLLAANGWLLRYRWREIVSLAREQTGYIVLSEALFAGAFALLIWIRAFIPDIYGTEKFMDEAFVSAIMRSTHLPPNDPWLSGYAINYYYLGHFIVATIAKLLGTSPAIAFNTGIALIFALMAINLFGVTTNVVTLLRGQRQRRAGLPVRHHLVAAAPYALAAVLFSLVFGNLFGANEWLTQLGVGLSFQSGLVNVLALLLTLASIAGLVWFVVPLVRRGHAQNAGGPSVGRIVGTAVFGVATIALVAWAISRIADIAAWLRVAWPQMTFWLGHPALWATYNWWNPSRAVHSSPKGYQNITEFPAFSFLLADLHAHVLALPFTVLAMGVALNFLLARGRGLAALGENHGWQLLTLVSAAVIIGSLYAMNGWDLPTYAGLALLCFATQQWRAYGRRFSQSLLVSVGTLAVSGLVLGLILYLPFIATFSSPSQGIGLIPPTVATTQGQYVSQPITFGDRTTFPDLWNVFGFFLTIVGAYLFWQLALGLILRWRRAAQVRQQRFSSAGLDAANDAETNSVTAVNDKAEEPLDVVLSMVTWGLLIGLVVVLFLLFVPYSLVLVICLIGVGICAVLAYRLLPQSGLVFTLMLAGTALALIGVCEVLYLRDVFDHSEYFRMNTIFKLYYQAWTLFAVSGGALLYELLGNGWHISAKQLAPAQRLIKQTVTPQAAGIQAVVGSTPSEALQGIAASRAVSATSEEGATPRLDSGGLVLAGETTAANLVTESQPAAGGRYSYSHEDAGCAERAPGLQSQLGLPNSGPPPRYRGGRGNYRSPDKLTPSLRALGLGGKLVWICGFLLLALGALVYPLFATDARTGQYHQQVGLDGAQFLETLYPGDAAAIRWINTHIEGDPVLVEATGGEYSDFARISTFTGLPTVLGWGGHEIQWRVNWLNNPTNAADFNRRSADLDTIYTSTDAGLVMQLLHQYHASYLYVGTLEYQKYPKADLGRFAHFLSVVYQAEGVTIYRIP